MSEPTEPTSSRQAVSSLEFWARQNPMLYLVVVLILGGHGLDFVNSNGLRDDVQDLTRRMDQALERLDAQERADEQFRRELDQVYRRLSYLETRTRDLEIARPPDDLPPLPETRRDHR